MQMSTSKSRLPAGVLAGLAAAIAVIAGGEALAKDRDDRGPGISQSGEQRNMRRVGHVDPQGRPSYHPNRIVFPHGRPTAFAGPHAGSKPNTPKPGHPVEPHRTMIDDVT